MGVRPSRPPPHLLGSDISLRRVGTAAAVTRTATATTRTTATNLETGSTAAVAGTVALEVAHTTTSETLDVEGPRANDREVIVGEIQSAEIDGAQIHGLSRRGPAVDIGVGLAGRRRVARWT
jgi:hypothetical protein